MQMHGIRVAVLVSVAVAAGGAAMRAQTQARPGVQVAVPQGSAQDQAAATTQQQRQQEARARLANEPAPRTPEGRIVIGSTSTRKGVWVGGNLGFCNANRVAGPASLNPGAAAGRGAGPGGAAPGFGRGYAGAMELARDDVVGVIGLGAMGAPMVRRLAARGRVVITGRSPKPALEEAGAEWAASPRELAQRAAAVLSMLPDLPELEAALEGPDGLLAGIGDATLLLLIGSTSSPTA